jgi:sn-glycerol 3-phosphate transport system permease protein
MNAVSAPATRTGLRSRRASRDKTRALRLGTSYVLVALAVAVVGMPLFWMLTGSLKDLQQIYQFPPVWWPPSPHWENYVTAWNKAPFGRFYINSIVTTVAGSALKLLNAVFTAYALAFLRVPGRRAIFVAMLAALMIPPEVAVLPNYLTIARLGWVNTYQGLVLPGAGVAFVTFLLRQSFLGLPGEVIEAAIVDGAGHVRRLWSVVLPMSRPALATALLLLVEAKWNEFLWPLVSTSIQTMRTLPVGIAFLVAQETQVEWHIVMAGTVFVIAPVIVLFLFVQRQLVAGLTSGAVKG